MTNQKAPSPQRSAVAGLGILFVHPEAAPRFVSLTSARALVGRDPASAVPLQGRAVSWHHAELQTIAGSTLVRDLESTNGVQLEGRRVREARLEEGALLRIGDFLAVVSAAPWPEK